MRIIITLVSLVALADAIPKPTKLTYRNLFKKPVANVYTKPFPRIIGGQEAKPHSIPYQAFLEIYSETEGWYCGGSLISENSILTAAHCNQDGIEAHVTLGAHQPLQNEETQAKLISRDLIVHENYDADSLINDIGIIKLHVSLKFTDAIQVVSLPSKSEATNNFVGQTARISGWGLTDGFDNKISDVLNYVDVKVITNSECEDFFDTLPESVICTSGDQNTGSCNGDSGGPLTIDNKQIGIVSFGVMFCLHGFPSAFTRITSYLDWIETNSNVKL